MLVLKDRPYLKNQVEIDLGNISIETTTSEQIGRWKGGHKAIWSTTFLIKMKRMGIFYNKNFEIASPFDLELSFNKPNQTPLMVDSYISDDIDFTEIDFSYHLNLNFSPIILHLR